MKRNAKFCLTLLLVSAVCLSGMTISGLAEEESIPAEELLLVTDGLTTPSNATSTLPTTGSDIVIKGDVNGDGSVDLKDVTSLFQYVNQQISTVKQPAAADVNGDGVVDLKDATRLYQYVNKQITTL
jgi:hypothetical protein